MLPHRVSILLAFAASVAVEGYEKTAMGTTCAKKVLEMKNANQCKKACAELGYPYLGTWDGPGDFPACTFTEGLDKVCHFNTNSNPGRDNVNSQYSAICKECADVKSAAACEKQGKDKSKCDDKKWAKKNCLVTCGLCDPAEDADAAGKDDDADADDGDFEKAAKGSLCNPQTNELATENECKTACAELGFPYLSAWNGPGDFPKCVYTEGLNKVCHFNTSPSPGRTDVNSDYAAICKKA